MAGTLTTTDVLTKLNLTANDQATAEFNVSGQLPMSLQKHEVKKDSFILGITPEDLVSQYSAVEYDVTQLMSTFAEYCKDFNKKLELNEASRALEFSAKMLFEFGPYIRNEKRSKGDKVVKMRFPYNKSVRPGVNELSVKTVLVSTFKESSQGQMVQDGKLILTFKQATILAMHTFLQACDLLYNHNGTVLMTPLCGATFSKESIANMAKEFNAEEEEIIKIINASTAPGGHLLEESNIACAIVAAINSTKRMTDKRAQNSIIVKTIKQYSARHKKYESDHFSIFSKYALGGVPPGMDPDTLIQNFSNIQVGEVNRRMAVRMSKKTKVEKKPVKAKEDEDDIMSAKIRLLDDHPDIKKTISNEDLIGMSINALMDRIKAGFSSKGKPATTSQEQEDSKEEATEGSKAESDDE